MSCAPARLPHGRAAAMLNGRAVCSRSASTCFGQGPQAARCGARHGTPGQRSALLRRLRPRFAVSHALPRKATQPPHQPRCASGARDRPALHRMTERVSSVAVKAKPCGRCAAWTESAPQIRRPDVFLPISATKKTHQPCQQQKKVGGLMFHSRTWETENRPSAHTTRMQKI